jgi:hypothetical protein
MQYPVFGVQCSEEMPLRWKMFIPELRTLISGNCSVWTALKGPLAFRELLRANACGGKESEKT